MRILSDILEAIVLLIVLPIILVFKLLVVVVVFAFFASPIILVGWLIWMVAK